MEYLVPLLIFATVGVIGWLVARIAIRSMSSAKTTGGGTRRKMSDRISVESAILASARLEESVHREIYRRIAAGRASEAAVLYRQVTGVGVMEAMFDVQALAAFPQEWTDANADSAEPALPNPEVTGPVVAPRSPDTPDDVTDLVVPTNWQNEQPLPDRAFHVEVVREEGTVRLSSDELPAWLKDQLSAMVRDQRIEEGAELLANHSLLTSHESLDLLRIIAQEHNKATDDE